MQAECRLKLVDSWLCELCHLAVGVRFVDQAWACEECGRAYLFRMELSERYEH